MIFPASPGIFQYQVSKGISDISLWVLPHWYLMNWCAADITDGDKKKEREIELVWQHCGVNIPLFFSFTSPSHLPLSLCTTFPSSSPPSLTFTLSSLQEVLELAFSVLYESDEYLNFIAPDKHEVSQWWSSAESDRMVMCDRTKRKVILQCGVCVSVRYVLETLTAACLRLCLVQIKRRWDLVVRDGSDAWPEL